jgi:hypothetical protein
MGTAQSASEGQARTQLSCSPPQVGQHFGLVHIIRFVVKVLSPNKYDLLVVMYSWTALFQKFKDQR